MPNRSPNRAGSCSDPVVGAILSGWRYDISNISPEMRTDYEEHLGACLHCHRRQRMARTIDVLLLAVSSLLILVFLLVAVLMHKLEALMGIDTVHMQLRHTAVAISLEWVALAGLVVSSMLWILVAIATPLPGFLGGLVQQKLPSDLRERITRHAQTRI